MNLLTLPAIQQVLSRIVSLKILIDTEEMENLEIVKTLLNGVKSFLRINFQLKWKSIIMAVGQ